MPRANHLLFQRRYFIFYSNSLTAWSVQFDVAHYICYFSEFYTGWLTHWGEKIAKTDADFTAAALEKILSRNGSAVLYVC